MRSSRNNKATTITSLCASSTSRSKTSPCIASSCSGLGPCPSTSIREGVKKTFFWETFPKSVYPTSHSRVFVRFGRKKGKIQVEKGDFQGDLGVYEGFGPCLGISHTTHPHLGEISQKNVFFTLSLKGKPVKTSHVVGTGFPKNEYVNVLCKFFNCSLGPIPKPWCFP